MTVAFSVVAAMLVAAQRLAIFPSPPRIVAATLAAAALATLVARASLRALEARVVHNLSVLAGGRTAMFAPLANRE